MRQAQYFINEEFNTEIIFTFETTIKLNQTICKTFPGTKNPISQKNVTNQTINTFANAEIPAIAGIQMLTPSLKMTND